MGWGSGSEVMRGIIATLTKYVRIGDRKVIYDDLIPMLEGMDWDTQPDCLGLDPAFDVALRDRHPSWGLKEITLPHRHEPSPDLFVRKPNFTGVNFGAAVEMGYFLRKAPKYGGKLQSFVGMRFPKETRFHGVPVAAGSVIDLHDIIRAISSNRAEPLDIEVVPPDEIEEGLSEALPPLPPVDLATIQSWMGTTPEKQFLEEELWTLDPDLSELYRQHLRDAYVDPLERKKRAVEYEQWDVLRKRYQDRAKQTNAAVAELCNVRFPFGEMLTLGVVRYPARHEMDTFAARLESFIRFFTERPTAHGAFKDRIVGEVFKDRNEVQRLLTELHQDLYSTAETA